MLLEVENLRVSYGQIKALQGVSFTVDEGEIITIIGANGAGKSTALRAISRMVPVEAGSRMVYRDQDLLGFAPDKVVSQLGISHVPEGRRLFGNLTVMENLILACFARKDRDRIPPDLERVFNLFPRLQERQEQKAGTLSGGEQQMLAMGRGLMSRPSLLLLDEPSMGLAPILVEEIFHIIQTINAQGTSILLVEQNAAMALSIANRGYVLETGTIVLEGKSQDLLNNRQVKAAYLGE